MKLELFVVMGLLLLTWFVKILIDINWRQTICTVQGNDQVSLDVRQKRNQNHVTMDFGTLTYAQNNHDVPQHSRDTQISLKQK